MERAKAAGTWGDYTKHYGEKPPQWHILDARGVPKDAQISDFKGKWLLVYFWGLSCYPCLSRGIPDLIKFYEEHQAQRDRFEILALCMDVEGEVKSVADLDKRLQPVVKHVWGKPLPFPVLLDPSFTTMGTLWVAGVRYSYPDRSPRESRQGRRNGTCGETQGVMISPTFNNEHGRATKGQPAMPCRPVSLALGAFRA